MLAPQHERFVQLLLIGTSPREAYVDVFGVKDHETPDHVNVLARANTLARTPEIVRRLEGLRAPVVREALQTFRFDLNVAMQKCEDAYSLAETSREPGHMLKAVELQSKLTKLLGDTERRESSALDQASTAELVMLLKELRSRRDADLVIEGTVVEGIEDLL